MKFLVIEQDLRVSGTSQGIISRSFLAKLRIAYPDSIIDVVYLKHHPSEDQLDLLPVNSIETHILDLRIPFFTKWANKIYWRLFHISLKERFIHKVYGSYIGKVDYLKYDHIFIRSAGLNHEIILGSLNLPILKKAIVNFHDPYPLAWYVGTTSEISNLELFRLKHIMEIVAQAKTCSSTAQYMSHDLQSLYASKKKFYTLPHQFDAAVFDLSDTSQMLKKTKKVNISYHGALMFGRNIENLLLSYEQLLQENPEYEQQTEFVLRVKGDGVKQLKERFKNVSNIQILDMVNFANSSNEQIHESDIVVILENGPLYCNILVGKAAFLAAYQKPVLCISPEKSELRNIISDERCIANIHNILEIKGKLQALIDNRLVSNEPFYPFGDYFSDENFKKVINAIIK